MRPRPAGLRFRPNGWLTLPDGDVDDLRGSGAGVASSGMGRLRDAVRKVAVESRAIEVVHAWLAEQGYAERDVRDTSGSCPYDFEAGPEDEPVLRVEVKGLTGGLGPVEVTEGEVRSARGEVTTTLAIVHGIQVSPDDDGGFVGSGGTLWLEDPWNPHDENLRPTQYRYTPGGGRTV